MLWRTTPCFSIFMTLPRELWLYIVDLLPERDLQRMHRLNSLFLHCYRQRALCCLRISSQRENERIRAIDRRRLFDLTYVQLYIILGITRTSPIEPEETNRNSQSISTITEIQTISNISRHCLSSGSILNTIFFVESSHTTFLLTTTCSKSFVSNTLKNSHLQPHRPQVGDVRAPMQPLSSNSFSTEFPRA